MHFPSDTWGLFGRNVMKEYVDKATKERNSPVGIMKTVMEGLRMPVYNPKTGEKDHVDLKLVSNIVVEPQYIQDMVSNKRIKIDMSLAADENKEEVILKAVNSSLALNSSKSMALQTFEEILFKTLNEEKEQRLEKVEEFKNLTSEIIDAFIVQSRERQHYFASVDEEYELDQGIGIIRDIKTNQDIGTFESFEYLYNNKRHLVNIEGVILSGRTFDDLNDVDRFEYAFYSLDHQVAYSVLAGIDADTRTDENSAAVDIENYELLAGEFNTDHKYYDVVTQAQEIKSSIKDIDQNHPLYDSSMEKFRKSRLSILEESKTKQKQEKLVNQFADIDLDF